MKASVESAVAKAHRQHYRALVAPLIRILGEFEAAEDVVQETFTTALQQWPTSGIPDEPLAWLRRVAKNRAIDRYRRLKNWQKKEALLAGETSPGVEFNWDGDRLEDDTLRLIFTCCHPALSPEAQVGLTLRTICGLSSEEVARAFLTKTTTLQQRLVRAQKKIDQAKIPYIIPSAEDLPHRLSSVLKAIYLVFNEGYGATRGDVLVRQHLCDEAIRLARLVFELLPKESGPPSLLALMLLHHSRRNARVDASGMLVTLEDQDRTLWDQKAIQEALPLLKNCLSQGPLTTYGVEASIAALHAEATTAKDTDWEQIHALYQILETLTRSNPVVQLNRIVAKAMTGALEEGLAELQTLEKDPRLAKYYLLPAAIADLNRRLGKAEAATLAYERAIALVDNSVERAFLSHRLNELRGSTRIDKKNPEAVDLDDSASSKP